MASITTKKGKNGTTYYIVYSYKEFCSSGKYKYKIKWLYAGKTKNEASEYLRQFNKEYKYERKKFNEHKAKLFETYVSEEFLPWSKSNKSPKTHAMTEGSLRRFVCFFGNIYLDEVNIKMIEMFIMERKKKCSNRTVNIDLTYLSQALKKAVDWDYLKKNVATNIKKLKETSGRVRFFSREEINKLLSAANPYLKRLLLVGLLTGLRHGEILSIHMDNIDFDNKVIHIVNTGEFETKNRKNRSIPIHPKLEIELRKYINTWIDSTNMQELPRTRDQRNYLFCDRKGNKLQSFRKAYNRLLESLDITDATIHTMRHTYASHLTMNGVMIRTVQDLLGHHSVKVTEKYAHLSDNYKQQAVLSLSYPL